MSIEDRSACEQPAQVDVPETGQGPLSRRSLLGAAGASLVAAKLGSSSSAQQLAAAPPQAFAGNPHLRRAQAFKIRVAAALQQKAVPLPAHPDNGDEALYPTKIGTFSKSLPHNLYGEVDTLAYASYRARLLSEDQAQIEGTPHGCPNPALRRPLVNPMGGVAFDLEGADSHALAQPPAPAFASAWEAGEIAENYWMALLRDVPFEDYGSSALAAAAAADLTAMSDFRGPKVAGAVTPATLFREVWPGCDVGPYLSQFFWLGEPFGAQYVQRRMRTTVAGLDYMTSEASWLDVQNGCKPPTGDVYDPVPVYMRNGRDLGQWVHIDVLFQAYFQAALTLLQPPDADPDRSGIGAPLNPGNPYATALRQEGFGSFGGPNIAALLCEVATRALKAVWYQKWYVHRRLRPEAFGGRVHHKLVNGRPYPIHSDILNSAALPLVFSANGTYFCPMAFPEGSPIHPAYGAGHATVAGACVTILKALFDENHVIPAPVVPDATGTTLMPYVGPALTVGGELNKIAANVSIGRNIAGVHWRTDGTESNRLGEAVAISVLRDQRLTYKEDFGGFTFTKFDGTSITV